MTRLAPLALLCGCYDLSGLSSPDGGAGPDLARRQARWHEVTPSPAPLPRSNAALAYDARRMVVVLYGGETAENAAQSDTWEWNGTWRRVKDASPPGPRSSHAMVYDTRGERVVLFGGWRMAVKNCGCSTCGAELATGTWAWDGATWTELPAASGLALRGAHRMAHDGDRGITLLFGGYNCGNLSDTWELDGDTWKRLGGLSPPKARERPAMAWDPVRKEIVLFGGTAESGPLADTWRFAGGAWKKLSPPVSPGARGIMGMTFHEQRGTMVLFGGNDFPKPNAFDETWEWDGATWRLQPLDSAPPPRDGAPMVYDPARREVLLVGGQRFGPLTDQWAYREDQ